MADGTPQASWRAPTWLTVATWILLVVVAGRALVLTASHDLRDQRLVGDEASHVLQAMSLAGPGHDLVFDRADAQAWSRLHWPGAPVPYGLFYQRHGSGWAFAKPYGYSAVLAPFVAGLGVVRGVAVGNAALLAALTAVCIALLRLRYRGPTVPLVTLALIYTSYAYLYAFAAYVELWVATLVGLVLYLTLRALRAPTGSGATRGWALGAFALSGLAVAEKPTLLLAVGPLLALALLRAPGWRRRSALLGTGAASLVVWTLPYLWASGGRSWSPYGGQRYYLTDRPPWDGGTRLVRYLAGNESLSVHQLRTAATSGWGTKVAATAYTVVGRHTGLAVFVPIAVVVVGLALWRARHLDGEAWAALGGLGAYLACYAWVFSDNFYGGGQALGNRYALQVIALVPVIAVTARLDPRHLAGAAAACCVFGLIVLWPHHRDPSAALVQLQRTSPIQRLFPFEADQAGASYFRCGLAVCPPGRS